LPHLVLDEADARTLDARFRRLALLAIEPANPAEPGVQGVELLRVLTQDPVYQLR
jgi:hypothetical protein